MIFNRQNIRRLMKFELDAIHGNMLLSLKFRNSSKCFSFAYLKTFQHKFDYLNFRLTVFGRRNYNLISSQSGIDCNVGEKRNGKRNFFFFCARKLLFHRLDVKPWKIFCL